MDIKAILFDLDGTLLPMDQEDFIKAYMSGLVKNIAPHGYNPDLLVKTMWSGIAAMTKNNGSKTNEEVFWDVFVNNFGKQSLDDMPYFDAFYANEFQKVKEVCGFEPEAKSFIEQIKETGIRTVLATSPLFPEVATYSRIRWAGLQPEDFELITTYENSVHCKPNLDYYRDILSSINVEPENCLMIGNDVDEDMIVSELGINTFLVTDCLINKKNIEITQFNHGNFKEMTEYVLLHINK